VWNLAIKVEKQLKGRKLFHTSVTRGTFTHNDIETPCPKVMAIDKGKGIASEPPKRLEGMKCFKCPNFGNFQDDCANRTLSLGKWKKFKLLSMNLVKKRIGMMYLLLSL